MIEKVMKAVKRNSKRRSVNITIGAVVGFLLSCTTVMGAATALEIAGDNTNFTPNKVIEGNTFENNVYTNNGLISGESPNGTLAEGIKVTGTSNNKILSIVNKGTINAENTGTGGSVGISLYRGSNVKGTVKNDGVINSTAAVNTSFGIETNGTLTGNIKNNGAINSTADKSNAYGIILREGTLTGNVENNGVINSTADLHAYGIALGYGSTEDGILKNDGIINSTSNNTGDSNGIYITGTLTENIENTGTINTANNGAGKSYGIRLDTNSDVKGILKNTGIINSTSKKNDSYGVYVEGTLTGNIENAGIINSSSKGSYTYGIYNLGTLTGNIENNGIINAISDEMYVCGIYHKNDETQKNIVNRGLIASITESSSKSAVGIGAFGTNKDILNTGYINVSNINYSTYGITTSGAGKVNGIINNGNIHVVGNDSNFANGINVASSPEGGTDILNNGLIKTTVTGINIRLERTLAKSLRNGGVIYGKENAIDIAEGAGLGADTKVNYGLLINEGNNRDSILNGTNFKEIQNHGLAFSVGTGESVEKYYVVANENYTGSGRTIVNAELDKTDSYEGTGEVRGTISVSADEELIDGGRYIINGIDKTLKVDTDIEIKESMINAYGTAVVMEVGKKLTVEETIFNGGVNGSETISLAGNNTLNLSKESIVNGNMKIAGDNNTLNMNKSSMNGKVEAKGNENKLTIADSGINDEIKIDGNKNALKVTDSNLNKNIAIDGDENTLTISGDNTFINGDMEAKGTDNTVKLAGKSTDGSSLNMFNKVTGFENMKITGGNVTFFENAEVTGVKNLTVEDGTLNLRLKKEGEPNEDGLTKGGHAFSGNGEMVMKGLGDGGTLQFMTNGIGKGVWIDTIDMQIKNMNIETNSVLDGYKFDESGKLVLKPYDSLAGMSQSGDKITDSKNPTGDGSDDGAGDGSGDGNIGDSDIFDSENFDSINDIYKGMYSSTGDNLNAARDIAKTDRNTGEYSEGVSAEEQMKNLQAYLNEIYTQSPYALSSELSRRSAGMFRDIVTENMFRPDLNKWMIMGGLTHIDGGTKDTYYGEVYQMDRKNSLNTEADMKLTGAYALGKYGYSENVALGVTVGGNRSEAELSKSKVKGNSGYIGAFAENYRGNLTLKAGAGIQYSEYDADRSTVGGHSYNDKYSDMTYDIYLNGRYSNPVGENLFLEPYATLSYTYVDQEGTDEGSKALAIKTDSKSFEYTSAEVGVDLKKVIPHEKGKSTLSAGVSYTRLFNGADSDKLTGSFGGSDFDILVASKNKHNLGLNAKYTLELESGVLFDVKGSYSFERDSHKDNAKNRNKGEWMVGAGLGYKF